IDVERISALGGDREAAAAPTRSDAARGPRECSQGAAGGHRPFGSRERSQAGAGRAPDGRRCAGAVRGQGARDDLAHAAAAAGGVRPLLQRGAGRDAARRRRTVPCWRVVLDWRDRVPARLLGAGRVSSCVQAMAWYDTGCLSGEDCGLTIDDRPAVRWRAMRACLAAILLATMLMPSSASADPLADRVAALTKNFKGSVYVYAKNLKTGKEFTLNGDSRVKTASTIKLPILCALESLIAQGKVRWDERLVLKPEDKVTGSGVLGSLADGTDLTVRNIATLMIIVSDNTATNLIIDRITADAVNDYPDTIGIHQTRSNRKVRGDGNQLKAPTGWSKAGKLEQNAKFGLGVTTPHEMVQ